LFTLQEGDSPRTELHVVGSGVCTYEAKKGRKERKNETAKYMFIINLD